MCVQTFHVANNRAFRLTHTHTPLQPNLPKKARCLSSLFAGFDKVRGAGWFQIQDENHRFDSVLEDLTVLRKLLVIDQLAVVDPQQNHALDLMMRFLRALLL